MRTRAAILREAPGKWEVVEAELDPPGPREVSVKMVASGLCHSDLHAAKGYGPAEYLPMCGGHEGAGVVAGVGPDVRGVEVGDHIVTSFIPGCGRCRWCASGMQNLCDSGALMMAGAQLDGTYRLHLDNGENVGQFAFLGTFAEHVIIPDTSAIKISKDVSLTAAALLGCGVPTGWGSAVNAAQVSPGDVVIVQGTGGIGINAVQGAAHAGAARVIAADPVALKRETALLVGATDAVEDIGEATELARSLTNGQGADSVIVCVDLCTGERIAEAFAATRKAGTVVVTSLARFDDSTIPVNLFELAMFQKRIQGCLYGMMSPSKDVPRLLSLYQSGMLKLDELVTRTYALDEINIGYDDLDAGHNVRGVIVFG